MAACESALVRIQHHGRGEFSECFGLPALPEVHLAEVMVGAGVVGDEIDSL